MNTLYKIQRSVIPIQSADIYYFPLNAYEEPVNSSGLPKVRRLEDLKQQQIISLSTKRRKWLYLSHYIKGEDLDQFAIMGLPFSRIGGYILMCSGLSQKLFNAFNMSRLGAVKQLAYIRDSRWRKDLHSFTTSIPFNHTREAHSLDVLAIGMLIVKNNPCLQPYENLLHTAFLTHDARTPALGDTTKGVDPEFFDEDKQYNTFFKDNPEWELIRNDYDIDEQKLYERVNGKGVLGQVLNLADKIAYVTRDAQMYTKLMLHIATEDSILDNESDKLFELVEKNPYITDIWNDIKVIDDRVVIKQSEQVANFFLLRALMFKHVYYAPGAHFPERAILQYFLKEMYNKKILTGEEILNCTDSLLENYITAYAEIDPYFSGQSIQKIAPRIESFDSYELAERYLSMLDKSRTAFIDTFTNKTKTGVEDIWIEQPDGHITLFKYAFPDMYEKIQSIMRFPERYDVISFKQPRAGARRTAVLKRIEYAQKNCVIQKKMQKVGLMDIQNLNEEEIQELLQILK
jgi:HD superfamily phosphohydrolase